MVLEPGLAGICYIIRKCLRRPVTSTARCASFFCTPSASPKLSERDPARVIVVDTREETTTRLDLSDLCFVDDLVSLFIFWRKSQLSSFVEMVSQVPESETLRVNESKLGVLVSEPGVRSINAEIARGAYQSTFKRETIRATAVVKYLGCQLESQGNTHTEAQMQISKAPKAQARYSRGLWAPPSIGLSTNIKLWHTLALLFAAESHAWQPRDVETLENWQNRALRHIARAPVHVSRERAREDDPSFMDARVAALLLRIDLQHDIPSREQQWSVPAMNICMFLSYTTKANLCESEQQPRQTLTCEQWCGQSALAKRKQPDISKPGLECRDLSESRHGRAPNLKRHSVKLHCPCEHIMSQRTPPSSISRDQQTQVQARSQVASASAPTGGSAPAATSSQLWQEKKVFEEAQGGSKRHRQCNL